MIFEKRYYYSCRSMAQRHLPRSCHRLGRLIAQATLSKIARAPRAPSTYLPTHVQFSSLRHALLLCDLGRLGKIGRLKRLLLGEHDIHATVVSWIKTNMTRTKSSPSPKPLLRECQVFLIPDLTAQQDRCRPRRDARFKCPRHGQH